jgi:hypothetical protein
MVETTRFTVVSRILAEPRSRRQALSGLIGASVLAAGNIVSFGTAQAQPGHNNGRKKPGNGHRRHKRNNDKGHRNRDHDVTLCHHGDTFRVARSAARAHLRLGAKKGGCVIM